MRVFNINHFQDNSHAILNPGMNCSDYVFSKVWLLCVLHSSLNMRLRLVALLFCMLVVVAHSGHIHFILSIGFYTRIQSGGGGLDTPSVGKSHSYSIP